MKALRPLLEDRQGLDTGWLQGGLCLSSAFPRRAPGGRFPEQERGEAGGLLVRTGASLRAGGPQPKKLQEREGRWLFLQLDSGQRPGHQFERET